MLDDFVVVTITRPGPLYVRLKPDPRGLVVVNNFDKVPDDPDTGCPRLGPVENVGTVMPGDCLVSSLVLACISFSKSLQVAALRSTRSNNVDASRIKLRYSNTYRLHQVVLC